MTELLITRQSDSNAAPRNSGVRVYGVLDKTNKPHPLRIGRLAILEIWKIYVMQEIYEI